jgi:tape measure domain-containing protein
MPVVTGARVVVPVETNAAQAAQQLAQFDNRIKQVDKDLDNVLNDLGKLRTQLQQTSNSQRGFIGSISTATAALQGFMAIGAVQYVGQFAAACINAASQMEQWSTSFRVLTGNAQVAERLLADIEQFGATTPFEVDQLVPAAQQLLGMGISTNEIMTTMQRIGDVAAGLNIPLGDLSYLYGQIQSQGRAMTQDLNQFAARGIPIYQTLAEMLNTNVVGVRQMAEQGRISGDTIAEAFRRMTSEGGRFQGMMEAQSRTLAGQLSTMRDNFSAIQRSIGQGMLPRLRELVGQMNNLNSTAGDRTAWELFGTTIATVGESVIGLSTNVLGLADSIRLMFGVINTQNMNMRGRGFTVDLIETTAPPTTQPPGGGNNDQLAQSLAEAERLLEEHLAREAQILADKNRLIKEQQLEMAKAIQENAMAIGSTIMGLASQLANGLSDIAKMEANNKAIALDNESQFYQGHHQGREAEECRS